VHYASYEELGSRIASAGALRNLTRTEAMTIMLHDHMGWTYEEIGKYMGYSRQTISKFRKRGVEKLAKELGREQD